MEDHRTDKSSHQAVPRLRVCLAVAIAALCLVACGAAGQQAEATSSGAPAFCKMRGPNYIGAIEAAAPIAGPPSSGRLPIESGALALRAVGNPVMPVVSHGLRGDPLAYRLEKQPGHSGPPVALTVETTTSAVDPAGSVRHLIRRRTYKIESVHLGSVTFPIAAPLGLGTYRFDIAIRDDANGKAVHYGEYARVMKARDGVRFVIDRRRFSQGDNAYINVINVGTTPIGYGYEPEAQRFEGNGWTKVALPPKRHNGVVVAPAAEGTMFGPGESFGCERLSIPREWKDGRYRFLQPIYFPLRRGAKPQVLQVDFRVGE